MLQLMKPDMCAFKAMNDVKAYLKKGCCVSLQGNERCESVVSACSNVI